ncbi:hypothetical protein DERP_013867 [Dermatophagoides pteronyssinus]|uniref:Uncharacterized protein n=1 Tax=Dermatophagoides pteronyssinus TaxID=6956 RepID=A0ABQ8J2Y7_DERPT|nr:hypothetical protein DERP_013867 [Dermatophagoides pteronyssinus]
MFNIILFILSTCFIIPFIAWIIRQQRKSSSSNNDDLNHYDNKIMSSVLNETMCPATKIIDRRLSSTLVKTITIKTCVGIYNDQMKQWRPDFYRYATNDGLELTINYVDTLIVNNDDDNDDHFEKTIVAIHGVPGYYTHFDKLVEYYRNTNVRVIVPNLPDFSHTRKTRTFWHTSIEKSTFLKDFLNKLNVKTIDCLICHSFGAQTAAAICENPGNIEIKSVAFLSPQPLWDPVRNNEMLKAFKHKSEWWYNFLSIMRVHKKAYTKLRFTNINEFLLLCTIGIEDDTPTKFTNRLEQIIKMNIPVVIIYGEKERLISKTAIQRLNEHFNIESDDIIMIDSDDSTYQDHLKLTKKYSSFVIKNGGHFTHCNHHQVANKIIDNLLKI